MTRAEFAALWLETVRANILPGMYAYDSLTDALCALWERLRDEWSILVRDFSSAPGLEGCLRVSVGTEKDNKALVKGLRKIMRERRQESAEIVE